MMGKKKYAIIITILSIIIVATFIFILHLSKLENNQHKDFFSQPSYSVELDMSISDTPKVRETAEIIVKINYVGFLKGWPFKTNITLPEGIELVDGSIYWEGELGQDIISYITIKPVKAGNWTIEGYVQSPPNGSGYSYDHGFIYLGVIDNNIIIYDEPFEEPYECPPQYEYCATPEHPGNFDGELS